MTNYLVRGDMKKYDLSRLRKQFEIDRPFFNEMLDTFIASTTDGIRELELSLKNKDRPKISHYAHKIISPCRYIDAISLIELLHELEVKANKTDFNLDEAALIVDKIKKETRELIEAMKTEYM